MYKIGNQYINLKEVFSVSDIILYDGYSIRMRIKSNGGAETLVTFVAIKEDNCKADLGTPQKLIDRTLKEVGLFLSELNKHEK